MGLAGKKQDMLGETVLAVGTFDLLPLSAQIKDSINIKETLLALVRDLFTFSSKVIKRFIIV
jgi:hypothetical protein